MAQTAKAAASKPNMIQRFIRYLGDVRAEMRRVVWPTRKEVLNSSVIVVTTLLIMVALVFTFDQIVLQIVRLLTAVRG
ncbi:MAG: preprotein translocase subunit SecE [Coriobacteriaceae bacterium]|nr:preprotein translocase subunit SecE [Coriobacteriaceae bacterium]